MPATASRVASVVVGQAAVDHKTNEIKVAQPLLDSLDLVGHVVTADAMHTPVDLARYLVNEKHADYVLTVKDNQRLLKQHLAQMVWDSPPLKGKRSTRATGALNGAGFGSVPNSEDRAGFRKWSSVSGSSATRPISKVARFAMSTPTA
jgi:putative NIF3 family GTP cyclohydrolase 1 type 2